MLPGKLVICLLERLTQSVVGRMWDKDDSLSDCLFPSLGTTLCHSTGCAGLEKGLPWEQPGSLVCGVWLWVCESVRVGVWAPGWLCVGVDR